MRPLHISELAGGAPPKPASQKTLLEEQFAFQVRAHQLPAVGRQVRLISGRQWRWDFTFPEQLVSVEIDGLIVMRDKRSGELIVRGGHATPQGMRNGMEKDHAVILVGWTPLHFERNHITSGYAIATVQRVSHQRLGAGAASSGKRERGADGTPEGHDRSRVEADSPKRIPRTADRPIRARGR